ncbi:MAG TPA: amino acid adenylation domain-containing protein, partial [Herpetosiphonaceae bacterium]
LDVIVGLLGILKAGGAYVPIDPAYPAQRQALILADAQAPVLLTQQHIAAELPESAARIVCLDAEWSAIAQLPDTPPASAVTPDHLAYVIYTSGSTGTPKGVQVTHAKAGRLFAATDDGFHFDERDVWTLFHSTAFDFSVWEIWGALLYGGRLVVVPYWISRSPDAFADLLRRERVTVLNQTPSAFRQLVQAAGSAGDLPLRLVIFGGEALNLASLQSWFAHYPDRMPQLVNMYGITETTVHVTYRPLTADDARVALGSMIGVPIPDLQLYILDQQMQPVPVGVSGELYVGGGGVARGYLNRPALTAERFVPHPFSATPGARLYKSGDGARYRSNGDIEYLGRLDTQIKIRGFRIEIGEIEAVLSRYSGVRDAVVIVREDEPGEKRLVAYVVEEQKNKGTKEQENQEPGTKNQEPRLKDESDSVPPRLPQWERGLGGEGLILSLRAFLAERLPSYMVPSAFVVLDAIPLTAHGKVDRRALPAPDSARPMPEDTFVAPRTADEEIVAQIWAEVLHLDRVGILDNFFGLGGHSLLATQVISKLRAAFQIELPLRVLFETPTIAGLSERIAAARYDTAALLSPPLGPIPRNGALPLSFAQQRLWFLDQLEQDNPIYNLPFAAYLTGKLDIAALGRSLDAIVARHEVLRTTFETADHGQPVQVIAAAQPLPLPLVDLQDLPEHERDAEVRRLATSAALQPFDVARGPLLRATLLRLHGESHVLLLTMHHIVADGWSMGVFVGEISALYAATVSGTAPALPALPIQYADYAVWQRDWLQGAVLERQLTYWRQQLADLPVLELPTDYPRPPALSFRGALHPFTLPKTLSDELVALSQREGVTLFMTLLAAWQVLLSRYSGQDDIAVGTPIAGRTRAETEDLIGFFVNTLVLRANLAGNPTFSELLGRVRAVCLGAYAHQDLPFEQVVEELQPVRDLSRHPLFQVMFTLQNAPVTPLELPDLKVDPLVVDHGLVKFDLSLEFEETASGLVGMLAYNTDLFTEATIGRMLGHLQTLLNGIVADVDQPLAALPLLTGAEVQQLRAWSPPLAAVPPAPSVPALFAAQAAHTPDAVALVCGGAQLTYRALDQRANQLAHALRARGVGPDVRVGLLVARSLDLVVALLGIWKAGGAYVPIDPAYPAQRQAFLLEDAQIPLLVTQEALLATVPAELPTLCLDRDAAAIAQQPITALDPAPQPAHLAYVIYTSGSTGQPKGVAVTHANLRATLWGSQQQFALQADDVMPWIASVAFDIALFELLTPLLAGGTVRLLTPEEALDAPTLLAHLQQCTAIHAVPSLMQHLVQAIRATGEPDGYAHMRQVFVGGDRVPPELLGALQTVFAQAQVWVLYGPTEATIICARYLVPRGGTERGHPLGQPLPHAEVRVWDAHGQLVPIGVAGELVVGGPAVTRGYLQRPELTAEKFVAHDGVRWYRTGDRARYRADGVLEFLGRVDTQVKVRGYRIELGEVEAALGQQPGVAASVVVVREDVPGDARLVAYVVEEHGNKETREQRSTAKLPSPTAVGEGGVAAATGVRATDAGLSASGLRSALQAVLPEYLVPSAVV